MTNVHTLSTEAEALSVEDRGALLMVIFSSMLDEIEPVGEVEAEAALREMNLVLREWQAPPEVGSLDIGVPMFRMNIFG